ncbi:hypothetical protein RRG08_032994 [Elysia crispata]|uniref:Uncharacterized protein n=1 Tax=Elysia crispata TaxID=231223 RepID=A0AAE0YRU0_9GAST|nr:hypothetical protein RRG08_032994 [Elysia crispata]
MAYEDPILAPLIIARGDVDFPHTQPQSSRASTGELELIWALPRHDNSTSDQFCPVPSLGNFAPGKYQELRTHPV